MSGKRVTCLRLAGNALINKYQLNYFKFRLGYVITKAVLKTRRINFYSINWKKKTLRNYLMLILSR